MTRKIERVNRLPAARKSTSGQRKSTSGALKNEQFFSSKQSNEDLKDLLIANLHIKSQNFQETDNVYQMCLICYTNHFKNYNCQTDLQNGFSSSDEENLTPTDSAQWLEGQEVTHFPYNQPFFEGYNYQTDMDTGFYSSDDEHLTQTESVQWFAHQEVIQMNHQVTEGCYNPYYQNQVDNV